MKLEINIPTELKEIKLLQYQKFLDIANDELLQQKMIQIFCNVNPKDVAQMKFNNVEEITTNIISMFAKEHKFIQRFKIGPTEFGFIPNLENITLDEYVDITTYINDFSNMHKAMAVMFRPITEKLSDKYSIEPYKNTAEYSEIMKNAPLDAVLGSIVFFYNLTNELLKSSMNYLEKHKAEMNIVNNHSLENGGDGIVATMHLLEEMCETLRQSEDFNFLRL
jgi:hypothetical protein